VIWPQLFPSVDGGLVLVFISCLAPYQVISVLLRLGPSYHVTILVFIVFARTVNIPCILVCCTYSTYCIFVYLRVSPFTQ